MRYLIAVSGPIAVGKSAMITELKSRLDAISVSTREVLQSYCDVQNDRSALQILGERLDRNTNGKWVADSILSLKQDGDGSDVVVIDSVRIREQVDHVRESFGSAVIHVHLTASPEVLRRRFFDRIADAGLPLNKAKLYRKAKSNSTEASVDSMASVADLLINTDRLDPASVATFIIDKLGLFSNTVVPLVDIVVGGQFGSEGKGNICDFIARDYDYLLRVGGPNAGHRVADPEYDYVHIPSGTGGNPNAKILIGAGATLDIVRVLKEIYDWKLTPDRLTIDPCAIVIEQSDRDYEENLGEKIGSTKKGVGVATARKILGRDGGFHLGSRVRLVSDIKELAPYARSVTTELEKAYSSKKRILLEGTQGTDLSIHHGLYPKVTSRETTASGCLADAGISPRRVDRIFMVTRTYPIRVGGKSGDMGIEIDFETIADRSGVSAELIRKTEVGTISKKQRRIAEFSWEQVRRAVQLNGATDIVLTFADYLSHKNQAARTFDDLTLETKEMITKLEKLTGVAVSIISVGFGRDKILDRRGS